jgi:hypothetical protein
MFLGSGTTSPYIMSDDWAMLSDVYAAWIPDVFFTQGSNTRREKTVKAQTFIRVYR